MVKNHTAIHLVFQIYYQNKSSLFLLDVIGAFSRKTCFEKNSVN